MNEILNAITTIKTYFKNPENFRSTSDILQGILVSNCMDAISEEFIKEYVEPQVKKNREELIVDIGAKA